MTYFIIPLIFLTQSCGIFGLSFSLGILAAASKRYSNSFISSLSYLGVRPILKVSCVKGEEGDAYIQLLHC
jgi:hypothetical protein